MRFFILHADADKAAADDLLGYLKSRGPMPELDDGSRTRFLQPSDVLIVLWSQKAVFSTYRMQMEKRMLDAWADQQLVLVKLDHGFLPVGLRDLPVIDAGFESGRALSVWPKVERAAKEAMNAALVARQQTQKGPPSPLASADRGGDTLDQSSAGLLDEEQEKDDREENRALLRRVEKQLEGRRVLQQDAISALEQARTDAAEKRARFDAVKAEATAYYRTRVMWWQILGAGAIVTAVGVFVGGVTYIDALAARQWWLVVAALALVIGIVSYWRGSELAATRDTFLNKLGGAKSSDDHLGDAAARVARLRMEVDSLERRQRLLMKIGIIFVSYAHADDDKVSPVVKVVEASGRTVWIDKGGIQAGEGWAGEIVRGIKGATSVMVMCSPKAFKSDHIKREVYLADRYKKPMLPVFVEEAAPPEDFEYFFAGVQWLELFRLPEAERSAAVTKALGQV